MSGTFDPNDRSRLPVEPWGIVETNYHPSQAGVLETILAVGNGHLGLRGNHDEGTPDAHAHGTFVNGFHETWPIKHAEEAYGFATVGQTIVNVPDAKTMALTVDDEPLDVTTAHLERYRRWIDFREGILHRDLVWVTNSDKRVHVESRRLVSFTRRELSQATLTVTVLDADATVTISSEIRNRQDQAAVPVKPEAGFDPRKAAGFDHRVLIATAASETDGRLLFGYRTANSGLPLALAVDHDLTTTDPVEVTSQVSADLTVRRYTVAATANQPLVLTKTAAYVTAADPSDLLEAAGAILDAAHTVGAAAIEAEQRDWLASFWERTDIEIGAEAGLQQAVRWCLFQLAQAAARADGGGIGVKGVSGSGYEGHYFWDTEVYLVPFLAHTNPEIARHALQFRLDMLPAARRRAAALGQRGALFPWRTINGEEASAYYPAGTAQYHIDADVAFALAKYAEVCGDDDFLITAALPVLVETARLWVDLGFFAGTGSFHIHGVTGPDEYTAVVDDNLYTNVMARENLWLAAAAVRRLAATHPDGYRRLAGELGLEADEPASWQAAADAMTIPFDESFGVHGQDADFFTHRVWDLSDQRTRRPLLLHYHPLVIYRYQVLKQADAVLALFMAPDRFTAQHKRADYEYYDPITTGDSTLSAVVQSIIAAEVGYPDRALDQFLNGVYVDLADLHHNTSDGVHIASAGGVWNALVYGFAGLRDAHGNLSFDPRLPQEWDRISFRVRLRGGQVGVVLTAGELALTGIDGPGGVVTVRGEPVDVVPGRTVRVALDGQGPRLPAMQGTRPYLHGAPAGDDQITLGLPLAVP